VSSVAEGREGGARRGRPRDANVESAILDAAVAIINEVGYDDLSIEAVASRAGVGRPTVYRRWPSKLDLVVDAVVRLAPAVSAPDTGDVFTDLVELISGTIEDMTSSSVGRTILALAGTAAADRAELADRFNEHYLVPRRAAFLATLRRGIDTGRLRADIDPDLILDLMLGAPTYWWVTTGHPIDKMAARRVVETVWSLVKA
jgi:AcrR family transcriptional regulator